MKDITLTVSSKGQITLPVAARKKLGLKPGSKLNIKKITGTALTVEPQKTIVDYFGKFKGVWGDDPVKEIRELRDRDTVE